MPRREAYRTDTGDVGLTIPTAAGLTLDVMTADDAVALARQLVAAARAHSMLVILDMGVMGPGKSMAAD